MTYCDFQKFLEADEAWSKLDAFCDEAREQAQKCEALAHKHACDYEKWNCCEKALIHQSMELDLTDSSSCFASADIELASEYLREGQATFTRRKRDALAKAGEASAEWLVHDANYEELSADRQERRNELHDQWIKLNQAAKEAV